MKKKIRSIEDFPKVEHSYGKYYAYNSETGESAIFNDEKQLLFYDHFSPGGKFDLYPTHGNNLSFLNWEHDDLLPIGWIDATTHEPINFGLYNIKTKSYVLPMNKYRISYRGDEIFFRADNSLFIIDIDGNFIGELSNCKYFERDFYNSESKTVIVCEKFKRKYKYGVYSCKEKKMIIPIEFDKIQHDLTSGFIVTKNQKMGIYSYEGEVLTELDSHYIKPLLDDYENSSFAKTLVRITNQSHDTGVFTLDHRCIVPMGYSKISYYSDELLVLRKHNLSWTIYSISKKKFLVPPCCGVSINYDKDKTLTFHATKYLSIAGTEAHLEEEEIYNFQLKIIEKSENFIRAKYKYYLCYDIYSADGELIKEDVVEKISSSYIQNPHIYFELPPK